MSSLAPDAEIDQYKKRAGTSGISGQLYETKLISLILFRLLHNENVEEFYLASNVDEIGAFDDVCLKLKLKNYDRSLLVLVQAKHKENDDTTLDDKNELVKWCESIMKVKEKFGSTKNEDKVFKDSFNDIDSLFIVYTNAKYDFGKLVSSKTFENSYAADLNNLISTGSVGSQPLYSEKDVEDFGTTILNEEIPILAERFEKYLNDSQSMNVMNNEYIVRYHVLLRQKVVNVSETQEKRGVKCRILSFRDDFYDNDDKYLALLRKHLYEQILKNRVKIKNNKKLNELILSFLSDPCATTLSPLIENHIIYKNGKLEFLSKRPETDIQRLEQIDMPMDIIDETKKMTARSILSALKLSVPIAFGNVDLAIRGTSEKIEQRLNHLTKIISELFEKSKQDGSYKIIIIDDTIDEGILSCNGGIGGGVGNLLNYDEKTNLLKFTNDHTSLQNNAKSLYLKLEDKYKNLDEFRFDVQTSKLPKLSLDCNNVAREFLSKLLIFAKQGNHFEVEKVLKKEIEDSKKRKTKSGFKPAIISVDPEVMFVHYHHEIQKWWMLPKSGPYLTKTHNIYSQTLRNILKEQWENRQKNSLANWKRKRYLSILKKHNDKSLQTDTENIPPNVLESTSGHRDEPNAVNAVSLDL